MGGNEDNLNIYEQNAVGVVELAKNMPNNKASRFIEWFTYGENTTDGKSKTKAYTLFVSPLLDSIEVGTVKELQQVHAYLFGGLYDRKHTVNHV